MDKFFQNKWAIRVISLVFAISLYLYVGIEMGGTAKDSPVIPSPSTSSEVQVLDEVPLEVRIGDDYVVSGVPEFVSVSLEGKPRILRPVVRQQNFKVLIDLNDLSEGEHTVNVEYENIPEDLKVYIEPKSIDVLIEKRASKEFTVDVDFVNLDKLPLGYELGEPEVNPETVTVVSSENVIDQIAMVKVFINVSDLKESIRNKEVPISVYDIQGNDLNVNIEPASVTLSVPVERPSKTVPLTVATKGELPDGYSLNKLEAPKDIEIFGKREVLNEIESISTEEIDLSKIEKSDEYETGLDFPEGIIANDESIKVNIDLEQKKSFENINIDLEGENADEVTFKDPDNGQLNISAHGSDKVIGKLTKSDIKALIDVNDLSAGTHKVNVKIEGPDGITFEPDLKKVTIEIE